MHYQRSRFQFLCGHKTNIYTAAAYEAKEGQLFVCSASSQDGFSAVGSGGKCVWLIHLAVQQKVTQHCKANTLQLKKKKNWELGILYLKWIINKDLL